MGAVATISSKGQITLPAEVRDRLGVHTGDKVEFVFNGTQTVVKPVRTEKDYLANWVGIAKDGEQKSSAEVIQEIREMRGWDEWDFKEYGS